MASEPRASHDDPGRYIIGAEFVMKTSNQRSTVPAEVWVVDQGHGEPVPDELAVEDALEIRLRSGDGKLQPVAVTMRTPGADFELAVGFLFAEGVIREAADIVSIERPPPPPRGRSDNLVEVKLRPGLEPDLAPLERHFFTTSACGLCGKASLDALLLGRSPEIPLGPQIDPELLYSLPEKLSAAQGVFRTTGGLHGAGLFDVRGELLALREDVGRHNAVDKLIGWALQEGRLPLHDHILLVSGRASYEILQKGLMAELPIVCAISAPSSLAVALAKEHGMTLVAFLRDRRFNAYTSIERLGLSLGSGRSG